MHNPYGVGLIVGSLPRVALASRGNPGLYAGTPLAYGRENPSDLIHCTRDSARYDSAPRINAT